MKKIYLILFLFLAAHLFLLFKLQFTAWPEMLSFPFMIDKGFLIYKDFHHVYQPLLTFVLFGYYKIFGFTPAALVNFTWAVILSIDLLIFLVSCELFKNKWLRLLPVGVFVILQPAFEGNMMWFDLAAAFPLLISVYFILKWSHERKIYLIIISGVFLSLAFLIKQQIALTGLPILIYLLLKKVSLKDFLYFTLGGIIPLTIVFMFLIKTGDLKDYFFWVYELPLYWLPRIPGYATLPIHKEWFIMALMVVIPVFPIFLGLKGKKKDFDMILIYGIFATLLVSAFPRFSFFHLQPALAFFALLAASIASKNKVYLFLAIPFLFYIGFYRWRLTTPELTGGIRFYGNYEKSLANYIDSATKPTDKIYLLGSGGAIYVYSNRVPPKPWIENYVWHFEIPGIQEKVINGWRTDPPKMILWTPPTPGNWYDLGTYQPKEIAEFIKNNYLKKETVEGVEVWVKK